MAKLVTKYAFNFSFLGPNGCGKTLLGSEAVKIKDAKLKDMNLDVEILILTFNTGKMNYERLNQDLKNKFLKSHSENDQLKIQHYTDFLKAFHEEHKHLLNQTEKDLLQKELAFYQEDGSDFKSVLLIFCKIAKLLSKNFIIMIDELYMDIACGSTRIKGKNSGGTATRHNRHLTILSLTVPD